MKLRAQDQGYIEWGRVIRGAIEGAVILAAALALAWYLF